MTIPEQIAELLERPRGEFTQRQRWLLEAVELLLKIELTRADFDPTADFAGSLDEAYRAIRERKAAGGPGWTPKEPA